MFPMRANFIKSTIIALIGLAIFAAAVFFLFSRQKSNVAPEDTKETAQDVSPADNESSGDANADTADTTDTLSARTQPDNTEQNKQQAKSSYPLHTNITATVFWVGEPQGGGSSEDNALSAWDDAWQKHFGCFDDPSKRDGYHPRGCTPKENPFYFDLPYDDFNWDTGDGRRSNAFQVVSWAGSKKWGKNESMLKNHWIKIIKGGNVCYAQWEDSGPYVYDDAQYVFGTNDQRPKSKQANNAGMDVSPAVRDCLKFQGLNNDINKVSWQFVESGEVPAGPWKNIVTTSGTYWK
jgi:hypothetical protein